MMAGAPFSTPPTIPRKALLKDSHALKRLATR
jgi:hypothetical protein